MQKEDTSLMNALSYWKQAKGEIHDGNPSSPSTRDVIEHSISDDLKIVLSTNVKKDKITVHFYEY